MSEREQELFDRAVSLIMDEHSYTRQEVMEWLEDDSYGWDWILGHNE